MDGRNSNYETLLKQSIDTIDRLQKRVEQYKSAANAPIAVIGMSCRFPGAENCDAFWKLLDSGSDAIVPIPNDRWDVEQYWDESSQRPDGMVQKEGGFIGQLEDFDARFFGIAPREAASLDPQQRLTLELAWEVLEDACIDPETLIGSDCGVFLGICSNDYRDRILSNHSEQVDAYFSSGNSHATASGRVSYFFGFKGPSLSIDTACSSSLVALHQACRALQNKDATLALCGGVNRIMTPEIHLNFSRAGMLSPDSRCKAFDARANGFVRSEGGGMLLLKRLDDAERDGDRILSVIRGSAINQDGRSSGLTVPNGLAQQSVIRKALENASLDPADIDYLEAHGTGTALGDPIEMESISSVFADRLEKGVPLQLGAVKTNIGHLEAAAGVAGLIKTILMMQRKRIPANLHFKEPNPHIDWEKAPVIIPSQTQSWPTKSAQENVEGKKSQLRYAGVSAFGFSGTNAHVVLSDYHDSEAANFNDEIAKQVRPLVLALSAPTKTAFRSLSKKYQQHFARLSQESLINSCFSSVVGRKTFTVRRAVCLDADSKVVTQLQEIDPVVNDRPARIAFLFSGQGSQFATMGQDLYQREPVFRNALDKCCKLFSIKFKPSLIEILWGSEQSLLNNTRYTQPALFSIQYSLVDLWRHWGVVPHLVLGHSVGEVAAAVTAGIMSLEDAVSLVNIRAELMQSRSADGGMLVVFAGEDIVRPFLSERINIAAINASTNIVVAGSDAELIRLQGRLEKRSIKHQRLSVSKACHSKLMEPVLEPYREALTKLTISGQAQCKVICAATGKRDDSAMQSVDYWISQLRGEVRFKAAMETLQNCAADICVEIGPGRSLLSLGSQTAEKIRTWLPSLLANEGPQNSIYQSLTDAWSYGADVDWHAWYGKGLSKCALPHYPFEREYHWYEILDKIPRSVAADFEAILHKTGLSGLEEEQTVLLKKFWSGINSESNSFIEDWRNWIYQQIWRARGRSTGALTQTDDVFESVINQLRGFLQEESEQRTNIDDYRRFEESMEAWCLPHMMSILQSLSSDHKTFGSVDSLIDLGIAPRYRRLLKHLIDTLRDKEYIKADGDGWQVVNIPVFNEDLLTANDYQRPEYSLTARCVANLDDVLYDRIDPVQLLFASDLEHGDQTSSEVMRIYRDGPILNLLSMAANQALCGLFKSQSLDNRIEILEIGAGTGGTTQHLLSTVEMRDCGYCFTDLSASFLEQAQHRFAEHTDRLEFRLLNIEQDPLNQGFAEPKYDVIIASNVLHATKRLDKTLVNVRKLLKPGGWLLLVEGTRPQAWVDLTFGLTNGWWHFEDEDLRKNYPLLSSTNWQELLATQGFGHATCLAPFAGASQQLIMAQNSLDESDGVDCKKVLENWQVIEINGFTKELCTTATRRGIQAKSIHRKDLKDDTNFDRGVTQVVYPIVESTDSAMGESPEAILKRCVDITELLCLAAKNKCEVTIVPLGSNRCSPLAESLRSLVRVANMDFPGSKFRWLQVYSIDGMSLMDRVVDELCATDYEVEVRLQDEGRYVPRIVPARPDQSVGSNISDQGAYLVTGGLGGMGSLVANWLADKGVRHLLLVGRNDIETKPQRELVAGLQRRGVQVDIQVLDLADEQHMSDFFDSLKRQKIDLRGVVHTAGVIGTQRNMDTLSKIDFDVMFAAKVFGTWNLQQQLKDYDVDFFVCFSSGAAAWGFRGQAHYAAANACMDGMIKTGANEGLPASTINWGFLEAGGMTESLDNQRLLESQGVLPIPSKYVLCALEAVISEGVTQRIVTRNDWLRFAELYRQREGMHLLDELFKNSYNDEHLNEIENIDTTTNDVNSDDFSASKYSLNDQLSLLPVRRRHTALSSMLQQDVASVLGMNDSLPGLKEGFLAMGVDSIMAVDLKHLVERKYKVTLPATMIYDHPDIYSLARVLLATMFPKDLSEISVQKRDNPDIEELALDPEYGQQELEELLAREIDELNDFFEEHQ